MPRYWHMLAMAVAMACGTSAVTPKVHPTQLITLTGQSSGAQQALNTVGLYALVKSQPALEFLRIQVVVSVTLAGADVAFDLNYPSQSGFLNQGLIVSLKALGGACTGTYTVTFDSASTNANTLCTGSIAPAATLPTGGFKFSTAQAQPAPAAPPAPTALAGQWLLFMTTPAAAAATLNSWSIIIDTQCTIQVPNSVNLGTATTTGSIQSLTCNTGYTATQTSLTCETSGFTPAACINGGGALMTWGLNSNPIVAAASPLIVMNMLGRTIVAATAVHYDPNVAYAWLPNGVAATRVALGDLCTLVLGNNGVIYQWGYCGDPTLLTATTAISISGQVVNMPGGALATMIYATHFTYAALTPGNQLVMWGVLVDSTATPLVATSGSPWIDRVCGSKFQATPTAVTGLPGSMISSVALAVNRVGITTVLGEVYVWGCNAYYNLGTTYTGSTVTARTTFIVSTPTKVTSNNFPNTVSSIAMGEYQTVILAGTAVYWWGVTPTLYNWAQTIASTSAATIFVPMTTTVAIAPADFTAPVQRDSTRTYSQISASRTAFAILTTAGAIYTWGYDYYPANTFPGTGAPTPISLYTGLLGRGTTVAAGFADAIGVVDFGTPSRTITVVAMGGTFGLGLDTSANVVQWGSLLQDSSTDGTVMWQWSAGNPAFSVKTLPKGDTVTWIAAGRDTAAALDVKNGAAGCPVAGGVLTSQDVDFIPKMTGNQRAKLVAGMSSVAICGNTNWVNSFLNVALLVTPYTLTMPSFSNGVTIAITQFNAAKWVVASTYSPTGPSIAAVGIIPAQGRLLLFLFQLEQMYLDSTMSSGNPMVVTVTVPATTSLEIVYVYRNEYRYGKALTGYEGSISPAYGTSLSYTLNLAHTSAVAGYGPYDNGDGSNEALLGLLALIALPVICALGLYIWLWYRYTHTEAVVEAANPVAPVFMMEPQPIVAPSPAYIPAAYPAAPAYYV